MSTWIDYEEQQMYKEINLHVTSIKLLLNNAIDNTKDVSTRESKENPCNVR